MEDAKQGEVGAESLLHAVMYLPTGPRLPGAPSEESADVGEAQTHVSAKAL